MRIANHHTITIEPISECIGKAAFDTASTALKVAKRRKRRGKPASAYKCRVCGKYHLGR